MSDAGVPLPRAMFRRRKILAELAYQLRAAASVLLGILCYSGLLGFLLFFPLMREFETAGSPEQKAWIAQLVLGLHDRFWPSAGVVAVLVAAQSLIATRRVAGPAYHIRRVLMGLADGALDLRVQLRRFDRLKDLEPAVNVLAERFGSWERARAESEMRLRSLVAVLVAEREGGTPSLAGQDALKELQQLAAGLGPSA